MDTTIAQDVLNILINGDHGAPFDILGPHPTGKNKVSIRCFRPDAQAVFLILENEKLPMQRLHEAGFYIIEVEGQWPGLSYRFEGLTYADEVFRFEDPYRFDPVLTDYDLHLFGEGHHWEIYDKLGAHLTEVDGVKGVNFATWAPNSYRVSVVGDFNNWDDRVHPMRLRGPGGVWELFIPGVEAGAQYKLDIRSHNMGYRAQKSDPYGFQTEIRPKTASIVTDLTTYNWNDDAWLEKRLTTDPFKAPMLTYEVHLGSWKRKDGDKWLTYRELADELITYVKEMGYTHIELMPIAEHPLDASWGYQVTGYYAVTSRYGTPQDFMYFIDQCHQNDIGVILDWVPAHFPKDGHGLSYFDGTHLYEHADSRRGEHPDWGTYIFNYGRHEVRNFLIANGLFWLKQYHLDGLRVDAVSSMLYLNFGREDGEWLPNEYGSNENLDAITFIREFNEIFHEKFPGAVTVAEESTSWPMVSRPTYVGGLGFTLKWNMGWMHDTLYYIKKEPIYRRYHHNTLTFSMMYAFSENFVLPLSHDEVVHLKGSLIEKASGDWWQKFATLRLLHGYQITHPGKKLLFMGQEFGQWAEWSEARSLDWHLLEFPTHQQMQKWTHDVYHFYKSQPALYEQDFHPDGFRWIEANDGDNSVFIYMRMADDPSDFLIIAMNFTPVPREGYRIGVPEEAFYQEVLNSDSMYYGGGNIGNSGGIGAQAYPWHGLPYSIQVNLPPLAIVIFKPRR